ncbi:MAG: SLBB domain-containing protein, partial [Thiothrix sp.]
LIERYVTVTGAGVQHPCNVEVPLGTPIQHVINASGGYVPLAQTEILMGGPMMGVALHTDQIPIVKGTNCILVQAATPEQPAMPCIRCGRCAESCPMSLLPQQLYWHARARDFDKIQQYHLFDCIECGCCAYVCPSHIKLVDYYRFAKAEIRAQRAARAKADLARERHEFHLERIERAKREKAERLAKHKAEAQAKTDDGKKAAIQAALERAKAKKAATTGTTTDEADAGETNP